MLKATDWIWRKKTDILFCALFHPIVYKHIVWRLFYSSYISINMAKKLLCNIWGKHFPHSQSTATLQRPSLHTSNTLMQFTTQAHTTHHTTVQYNSLHWPTPHTTQQCNTIHITTVSWAWWGAITTSEQPLEGRSMAASCMYTLYNTYNS